MFQECYKEFIDDEIISSGETFLRNTELVDTALLLLSFGVDSDNELFICAANGNIYKLIES